MSSEPPQIARRSCIVGAAGLSPHWMGGCGPNERAGAARLDTALVFLVGPR